MKNITNLLMGFLCCFATNAISSEPSEADLNGNIDLSVPQSAAFAALGIGNDSVADISNGKALVAALLQGFDQSGNLKVGTALEFSPYEYIYNKRRKKFADAVVNSTLAKYPKDLTLGQQLLASVRVHIGTAAGVEDADKADRYAVGINFGYRFNDYYNDSDYLKCGSNVALKFSSEVPTTNEEKEKLREKYKLEAAECKPYLSWTVHGISGGFSWLKTEDSQSGVNDGGFTAHMAYSIDLSKSADLLFSGRYINDQYSIIERSLQKMDGSSFGGRIRYGNKRTRAIVEAVWSRELSADVNRDYGLYSVGGEVRVFKDVWFRIAFSDIIGSNPDKKESFSGQVRYAFGDAPLSTFVE